MSKLVSLTLACLGTTMLAGCATVDSSNIRPADAAFGAGEVDDRSGIAYFLPRQLTKVTVKRTVVTFDKAIEALGKAQQTASTAKAAVGALKVGIKDTEDLIVAKGDIVPVRELLMARLDAQKKALPIAEEASTKADKEVDKEKATVATALSAKPGEDCALKVTINLELLAPTPDPAHGYRMSPRHNVLRDDEHKIVVANSLLQSTDIVAADRTADILVELATLAGALARSQLAGKDCTGGASTEVSAVADLTDPAEVTALNEVIKPMGARLDIKTRNWAASTAYPGSGTWLSGIAYRSPVDVMVHIIKCEYADEKCASPSDWATAQIVALSLPQAGPISYVRQDAGFMTKTKYKLAFKDGVLTGYDSNRPSELLEVARTPMRLVNGFFEGASKIISIRTGQADAQTALAKSETARLQAENASLVAALAGQSQLSSAQLTTEQSLLRDQGRRDAVNRCIGEKVTKGESYDGCFTSP